jgi:indolepyruvate ferredoxin oxidoreductase alpha subunit
MFVTHSVIHWATAATMPRLRFRHANSGESMSLTSDPKDSVRIVSGDEAVALAALDAGIRFSSAYPGTPATDIQEAIIKSANPAYVRAIWSINEKVAYESALAVAIAGQRSIVSMKQVGLNVAADAFMNSCPAGVNGGLVLVIGDDPECHSSQNKQDTRHYRNLSGTLLLEPSSSQEAYDMTREAFRLSEQFKIPVIVRLTTRSAYGCTAVSRTNPETSQVETRWPKEPQRFFIVPTVSRKLFLRLSNLQAEFSRVLSASSFAFRSDATDERRLGFITTGIGYAFAREMAPEGAGILKVAGEPFSDAAIASFVRAHREIIVLEDGDPLLEQRARAMAPENCLVLGRLSGHLKPVGELQLDQVQAAINHLPFPSPHPGFDIPPRIPEICAPCGYHKVFGALKQLSEIATPSDIGCNSLGGLPPYSVMDGVWSMGSSIGVACGLAAVGHPRIVAIIGDSTFYHAGIPPLIEAVHEGYKITILLLDNGAAAMTGGQSVPHRCTPDSTQVKVDMIKIVEAIGVTCCTPFDPHKLGIDGIRDLVEKSFTQPGVKVLLYRSQCGVYTPGYFTDSNSKAIALEKEA